MARDGSGNYSLPEAAFEVGEVIDQDAVNNNFNDIAVALSGSVAADGQTPATGNLPMGGYRHTGVDDAIARDDYATAGQVQDQSLIWCGAAGGTANAITLAPSPAITAYAAGQSFVCVASDFNTGATTVAVSGLAATAVWHDGSALVGGEIWTGDLLRFTYYDSKFYVRQESPRMAGTSGGRDYAINPRFDVAQWGIDGSVTATTNKYVLDGWVFVAGSSNATITREDMPLATTGLPGEQQYFIRSTSAAAVHGYWNNMIEGVRTLAGRQVTLTFWARSSTAGATITPSIVQGFGSGGSSEVETAAAPRTLSTIFDRYRQTITVPSISGKTIGASNSFVPKLTVGAAAGLNVDIAGIQVEEGPRYTVISPRPLSEELAMCKRYYQASYSYGTAGGTATAVGAVHSPAVTSLLMADTNIRLPVTMRATPTITVYSTDTGASSKAYDADADADKDVSIDITSVDHAIVYSNGSTFTVGARMFYQWAAVARI